MKLVSSALVCLLLVPHLFAANAAPTVKFAVAPKYPALTLAGRICGEVTVRVTIDRAGAVRHAVIAKGHPMLTEAALDAAHQWKFQESSAPKRSAVLKFSFVILPDNSVVQSQTIFLPPTGIEIRQKPAEPIVQDQEDDYTPVQHPISTT
jgi:TonB family protein